MRLRDENKRRLISEAASKLFSEQPFDKVRLDDVATAAGLGKGTVYIYFKDKEELYYSLVYEGLVKLVDRMGEELAADHTSFEEKIRVIVRGMVDFTFAYPQFSE